MSTKHTPGPWHTKAGLTQMCDDDATTVARGRPHGNDGAFWWIFSPAETHGDAEADARLIAAAPKLLQACAATLAGYPGWQEMIRAAYSDATGETP